MWAPPGSWIIFLTAMSDQDANGPADSSVHQPWKCNFLPISTPTLRYTLLRVANKGPWCSLGREDGEEAGLFLAKAGVRPCSQTTLRLTLRAFFIWSVWDVGSSSRKLRVILLPDLEGYCWWLLTWRDAKFSWLYVLYAKCLTCAHVFEHLWS